MRQKALFALMGLIVIGGLSVVVLRAGLEPQPGDPALAPAPVAQPAPAPSPGPAPTPTPTETAVTPVAEPAPAPTPVTGSLGSLTQYRTDGLAVRDIATTADEAWVATSGGVVRYRPASNEATLFDNSNGLRSNLAVHVRNDPALGLMVGTIGGGLALFNRETESWRHLSIADGLPDPFVEATLRSRAGDLWIGTWSGVCQVLGGAIDDAGAWTCYNSLSTAGGLPDNRIHALVEDNLGGIWAGTEAGIARFQGGVWRGWTHADGLGADRSASALAAEAALSGAVADAPVSPAEGHPSEDQFRDRFKTTEAAFNPHFVTSLAIDSEGRLWAGTWGGGLAVFQNELWRNFTQSDGLPSDHIHALGLNSSGQLMIGANGGFAIRVGEGFTVNREEDGLISNVVLAVSAGPDGSLWVGGLDGAVRFQKDNAIPNG